MSRSLARSALSFLKREDGVAAVECALLLALVVIICFAALKPATITGEPPPPVLQTVKVTR